MAVEIERKFLLRDESWRGLGSGTEYLQGYLSCVPERTVRVRIMGPVAALTVKGRAQAMTRPEFEYEIPVSDARELLALCLPPLVEKTRYCIYHGDDLWEVDEFHGLNAGLIVAECELSTPSQSLVLPAWIGEEVTGDPRYYNANLVAHPYTTWTDQR